MTPTAEARLATSQQSGCSSSGLSAVFPDLPESECSDLVDVSISVDVQLALRAEGAYLTEPSLFQNNPSLRTQPPAHLEPKEGEGCSSLLTSCQLLYISLQVLKPTELLLGQGKGGLAPGPSIEPLPTGQGVWSLRSCAC